MLNSLRTVPRAAITGLVGHSARCPNGGGSAALSLPSSSSPFLRLPWLRPASSGTGGSATTTAAAAAAATVATVAAAAAATQPPLQLEPAAPVQFYRRALPSNCLAFGSPEGKRIFREAMEAGYMEGYFALASQFRTQDEPAFCGLATLVMCLNSLEVDPGKVWKGPWRWFNEEMLDCCVPVARVRQHGLTLAEFACLASCNSLQVRRLVQPCATTADDADADAAGFADFEAAARDCCRTDGSILVASYSRRALGQTGDGHFAPIGGYHPGRQLVLIFDTARFKYPPHWVPLRQLWEALKLPDAATGRPRGYCVLAKARGLAAYRVSQQFATGLRAPDSPLLRMARDFHRWLAGDEEAVAVADPLALAASELGRLCERHRLADFVLCRQQGPSASSEAASAPVLAALQSLPACAPVSAAFGPPGRRFANQPADEPGPLALLTLLAWPLRQSTAAAAGPGAARRSALLADARDRALSGAPDCLAAEVQLLRNQLTTIFDIAGVRPEA